MPRGWLAVETLAARFVALQKIGEDTPLSEIQLPELARVVYTPLELKSWDKALLNHPNRVWVGYLLDGIRFGVRIGFEGKKVTSAKRNLLSASENAQVVEQYIDKECKLGRVFGPLGLADYPSVMRNRFGVIPKSGKPGKWRLIVDMSYPALASVNDGISRELTGMVYSSVVDAAQLLVNLGRGSLMAKIDVASAYRIIPVHPEDRYLLGMSWNNQLYVDMQLPFGLSSAPILFNAYADGLEWILRSRGITSMLHYLDDFLVLGAPRSDDCGRALEVVKSSCDELGVPLAEDKVVGPVPVIQFLGFILDSEKMEVRLPEDKLTSLLLLLREWQSKKSCRRKELEHLLGKLNHACTVVPQGRIFLRRMYDLLSVAKKQHFFIRLNQGFRSDLVWWSVFLAKMNRISMWVLANSLQPSVVFSSDASGRVGCGAVWENEWIQGAWPIGWDDVSIMVKELCPVVCACAVWGRMWSGKMVLCECDNLPVVMAINKGSAQESSGLVMHMLRVLFFISSFFGFIVSAKHVSGKSNVAADAVSRDDLSRFHSQVPTANLQATPIPQSLWTLVVIEQPDWLSPRWRELFADLWKLA